MLDIRLIRENPEMIRKNLVRRHAPDQEKLREDVIRWDRAWRKALAEADGLKRRRNEITKEIAAAKKAARARTNSGRKLRRCRRKSRPSTARSTNSPRRSETA